MFKRRRADDPAGIDSPELDSSQDDRMQVPPGPGDTGLGVPPYRPAARPAPGHGPAGSPPGFNAPGFKAPGFNAQGFNTPGFKEGPMGRSPFAASPPAPLPPQSLATPTRSTQGGLARNLEPEPAGRRTLVVGQGISVQGTVQDAERLVVEGTVEATMIQATELSIAPGGVFKGEVQVEDAEIAGTIDGTLTVRGNLMVRATGRLLGSARCRRLQVEDGGQITGRMEMLGDAPAAGSAHTPARPAETPRDSARQPAAELTQ